MLIVNSRSSIRRSNANKNKNGVRKKLYRRSKRRNATSSSLKTPENKLFKIDK
jgi:hypothetical protein